MRFVKVFPLGVVYPFLFNQSAMSGKVIPLSSRRWNIWLASLCCNIEYGLPTKLVVFTVRVNLRLAGGIKTPCVKNAVTVE